MYVSPSHPDYERLTAGRAPSEPSGTTVAVLERPGGRWAPDSELRVSVETYQGHEYVNLLVWTRKPDGVLAPTAKRLSVKVRELGDLADALRRAAELVEAEGRGGPPARPAARRPGPAPRRGERRQGAPPLADAGALPRPTFDVGFDEFASPADRCGRSG